MYAYINWNCDPVIFNIGSFGIEYVKEVQEPFEIGLRQAVGMDMGQILSLPFILIGLVFLIRSIVLRRMAVCKE